jgi:hypothetical protein
VLGQSQDPISTKGLPPLADHFQEKFGDILQPVTEAENLAGKAYTYRESENVIGWLQRGSQEHGESREKFRKTIFAQTRMAMKIRAAGSRAGIFMVPDPQRLAIAYESVKVRAVELTREAGLDPWCSELVLGSVQAAYATLVYGPNMADLVSHRLMTLIESGLSVADASGEATRWAQGQIVAAKVSPANSFGDDEEAIAEAILAKIRSEKADE